MNQSNLLKVFSQNFEANSNPPVWMMRQAGRFLPEYRNLRKKFPNFIEFISNSDAVLEVTMMPIKRFSLIDAAIIFCDILVIPSALGIEVKFIEGVGPRLGKLTELPTADEAIPIQREKLLPTLKAIKNCRSQLDSSKALIGFSASPWTLACYVLGAPDRNFDLALDKIDNDPLAKDYFKLSEDLIVDWLLAQAEYGADVLMLFDSWASVLNNNEERVKKLVIDPTYRIIKRVKEKCNKPIIAFPRNLDAIEDFAQKSGADAIGIGEGQDLVSVAKNISEDIVLQGNIHPDMLLNDPDQMEKQVRHLLESLKNRRHILNLGHGINPLTPIDNVERLLNTCKNYSY